MRAVEGRSLPGDINVKVLPKSLSPINYRELAARNENKDLVICIFAKTTWYCTVLNAFHLFPVKV